MPLAAGLSLGWLTASRQLTGIAITAPTFLWLATRRLSRRRPLGALLLFGLGWGFFDCNNMPILCQVARPGLRATGYGVMNLVSISCGGFADWGFGALRDRRVPLDVIFGTFAGAAAVSVVFVLLIRPNRDVSTQDQRK